MSTMQFTGTYTALVTPMRGGNVDYESLENLVESQIAAGVEGLVAVGTTGESPTLDKHEHIEVVARVSQKAAGRVPVLAGTGSNSTDEAIELVHRADEAGCDGHLQVTPYYNKPTPEGVFRHFARVAESTERPLCLYSVPGRTGIPVAVETMQRLREAFPHVHTIKEAGGDADRVTRLKAALGDTVTILSGDDGLTVPMIACGAEGTISVFSNVAPKQVVAMVQAAREGRRGEALALHLKLYQLHSAIFAEGNPTPCSKYLLHKAGLIADTEARLPLAPPSPENIRLLDEAVAALTA